jgi:hypothetical protein
MCRRMNHIPFSGTDPFTSIAKPEPLCYPVLNRHCIPALGRHVKHGCEPGSLIALCLKLVGQLSNPGGMMMGTRGSSSLPVFAAAGSIGSAPKSGWSSDAPMEARAGPVRPQKTGEQGPGEGCPCDVPPKSAHSTRPRLAGKPGLPLSIHWVRDAEATGFECRVRNQALPRTQEAFVRPVDFPAAGDVVPETVPL